jgi:hypothetical protein
MGLQVHAFIIAWRGHEQCSRKTPTVEQRLTLFITAQVIYDLAFLKENYSKKC